MEFQKQDLLFQNHNRCERKTYDSVDSVNLNIKANMFMLFKKEHRKI